MDDDTRRLAALPSFPGTGTDHLLAPTPLTAGEALKLFQAHYAHPDHQAEGVQVARVSKAEVAGVKVWLPDLTHPQAIIKDLRNEKAHAIDKTERQERALIEARTALTGLEAAHEQAIAALQFVMLDWFEGRAYRHRNKVRRKLTPKGIATRDIEHLISRASNDLADLTRGIEAKNR